MKRVGLICAAITGICLMVGALWLWQESAAIALRLDVAQPGLLSSAARCAAVSAMAIAQVGFLLGVVDRVYRRDLLSDLLKAGGGLVFLVAAASAIALGLAGR